MNKRYPRYPDDADYQTNAPSYYEDLARKHRLIKELSNKIWEYDNVLAETLEEIEAVLNEVIDKLGKGFNKEIEKLLIEWVSDGTLENIINETLMNKKADKEEMEKKFNDLVINVLDYGALGDGVSDDGEGIRRAYNALVLRGGGTLYFPQPKDCYLIKSSIESEGKEYGLIINNRNITLKGASINTHIKTVIPLEALIATTEDTGYLTIEYLKIDSNNLANFSYKTVGVYTPYTNFFKVAFIKAKDTACFLETYVSTIESCHFSFSNVGLNIRGIEGNIATSTTLTGNYANGNESIGFLTKHLTYSSFISNAVDNMPNGVAYDIYGRGINFSGNGAEKCRQVLRVSSFRGFALNGFYSFNNGSTDINNPTDFLFEFVTGKNATISGVMIEVASNKKTYIQKELGLTKDSYGHENITVLDDSFSRENSYYVPSFYYDKPIKFLRDDETQKDITKKIEVDELAAYINSLNYMTINHVITVEVSDGRVPTSVNNLIKIIGLNGSGKLIIKGNKEDNKNVILHGGWKGLQVINSDLNITFKDVTFESRNAGLDSNFSEAIIKNSKTVIFDNVLFNANRMNTSHAVHCTELSTCFLINNTTTENDGWFKSDIYKTDDTSCIHDKTKVE